MNNDGLEQRLLLEHLTYQLFWMRVTLNRLDMSGEYEKYKTKVGKINDTLGKAKRALIRLKKEIQIEQSEKQDVQAL